jgi:hypothetical protein
MLKFFQFSRKATMLEKLFSIVRIKILPIAANRLTIDGPFIHFSMSLKLWAKRKWA